MNGTFNGKIKITKAECLEGNCGPRKLPKKGETGDRKYAFKIECEERLPCAGKSLTTWTEIKSGKEQTTVVPLKFDGKTYTWVLRQKFDLCVWDNGRREGTNSNTITWKATPTKAAFIDGDFVVTEFKGTAIAKNMATKPVTSAACKPWEHSWSSDASMTAKRKR